MITLLKISFEETLELLKNYFKEQKEKYLKINSSDELIKFLTELYLLPNILFYYKRDFSKFTLEQQIRFKQYAKFEVDRILDYWLENNNKFDLEIFENEEEYTISDLVDKELKHILENLKFEIIKDKIENTDEDCNDHNVIFYFIPLNLYLGATGYSWSDQRSDFDEDFYKVKQVEKVITVWEKLKD